MTPLFIIMKKAIAFIIKNRKFLFWGSIAGLIILLIILIGVMIWVIQLSPNDPIFMMYIAGKTAKLEVIKLIGWGMSGLIAILSVIGLLRRAAALDKQNEMTEKGHIQERFKATTEHLGSERVSVRISAFYEFYRLAELDPKSGLKLTVFDILCAHLRQTTKDKIYQEKQTTPTEEVQSLLNIVFKYNLIYISMANLEGVNLQCANLQYTNMYSAILHNANLQGADLFSAYMEMADLYKANLQNAVLAEADLQKASMLSANLQGAILQDANLQDANLREANLWKAEINKNTKMPNGWKDMVKKDEYGKTGVFLVDGKGKVIEYL